MSEIDLYDDIFTCSVEAVESGDKGEKDCGQHGQQNSICSTTASARETVSPAFRTDKNPNEIQGGSIIKFHDAHNTVKNVFGDCDNYEDMEILELVEDSNENNKNEAKEILLTHIMHKMNQEVVINKNDTLTLTSPNFDPLSALYSSGVTFPFQDVTVYNNLSDYSVAMKRKNDESSELLKKKGVSYSMPEDSSLRSFNDLTESKKKLETASGSGQDSDLDLKAKQRFSWYISASDQKGKTKKQRNQNSGLRDVMTRMQDAVGPISVLFKALNECRRVKVWTRGAKQIRGFCIGYVIAFDKHWNVALVDVDEVFCKPVRKKRKIVQKEVRMQTIDELQKRIKDMSVKSHEEKVKSHRNKKSSLHKKGTDKTTILTLAGGLSKDPITVSKSLMSKYIKDSDSENSDSEMTSSKSDQTPSKPQETPLESAAARVTSPVETSEIEIPCRHISGDYQSYFRELSVSEFVSNQDKWESLSNFLIDSPTKNTCDDVSNKTVQTPKKNPSKETRIIPTELVLDTVSSERENCSAALISSVSRSRDENVINQDNSRPKSPDDRISGQLDGADDKKPQPSKGKVFDCTKDNKCKFSKTEGTLSEHAQMEVGVECDDSVSLHQSRDTKKLSAATKSCATEQTKGVSSSDHDVNKQKDISPENMSKWKQELYKFPGLWGKICERHINQLFIRGENIAVVAILDEV